MTRPVLRDLSAAAAAVLLVVAAVLVGRSIESGRRTLFVHWPPLFADWDPHVGPGTPAAVLVAAAGVAYGPVLAGRLRWRALLAASWGTALAWTWSLALVDGWRRGVATRLTTGNEYLRVVGRFHDIPAALRDFTHHIVEGAPAPWPAHIAGHPPAATLTFVLLDRIGLRGGGWAGAWCITVGATACVAALVAVRRTAGEEPARRAAPFLALAPGAVWVGASADGYFAAVAAWSVALLALASTCGTASARAAAAFGAGLLFGLTCYLSYGLTLFVLIGAGVLLVAPGRPGARVRALPFLLAGAAVVPAVFTALGFDWWEAYRLLVRRYYQGVGGIRPYGYWVWANLACTVFVVGLATVAGLGRAAGALFRHRSELVRYGGPWGGRREGAAGAARGGGRVRPEVRLAVLVLCALLALLVADLSGMSKAETERIWLPFAVWLLPSCALLPRPRAWLTAQAVTALLVNHLLLTGW
ncbi:hypothetical protein [Streptomyces tropicalis]|uniref:Integral membrane protein n=1 Tax=Streptomyces tropicalis TaxID=3034234 RepID=A0ABT6A3D4_9ACTN|nr:hypothetical protein [Streptomyces tropicalis]MDF3299149.1 hypothetical protein [Streptomyces tropicalis]